MPIWRGLIIVFCLLGAAVIRPAYAEVTALWDNQPRTPLVARRSAPMHTVAPNAPSLFAGTTGNSLFAPYPVRQKAPVVTIIPQSSTSTGRLRDLIASAEAGRDGYDAVVWAARVKPPRPPTQMTLGEIYHWIAATPGQHHAIGRYQFIPATLKRLVQQTGAGPDQRFTPAYQNQLADILLAEAGLHRFERREIGRVTFMNNLAKIWAGLPTASGRSHYHGYAGNKATITWAQFSAEMQRIYPETTPG